VTRLQNPITLPASKGRHTLLPQLLVLSRYNDAPVSSLWLAKNKAD